MAVRGRHPTHPVIPAKAGIHPPAYRYARNDGEGNRPTHPVIPAKAGIYTPAYRYARNGGGGGAIQPIPSFPRKRESTPRPIAAPE